jgi:hypothetical protein
MTMQDGLTAIDREPVTLFGRTYYWSPDHTGRLHLISHAKLVETLEQMNQDLADA